MKQKFQASLSRSQGRKSWCVIFRHPMRTGSDGKPGLRVRRGLGTDDQNEAMARVDQLNEILSNESYWKLSAKEIAARQFHPKVVAAFYNSIEAKAIDPWAVREDILALPGSEDGYSRVQLVGATGSGKTTLLRQLIGTDPKKERFPSTSTAKCTTFDMEIIMALGTYRCVVSFLPRDRVRFYIEECVGSAISAAVENRSENEVVRRLLEHSEQRFRLAYLIGSLPSQEDKIEDELEDDDLELDIIEDQDGEVNNKERTRIVERLRSFVDRVFTVSDQVRDYVAEQLDVDPNNLSPDERDSFLELIEDSMCDNEKAQSLIDDILTEVESKFELLQSGEFKYDRSEWPILWTYETDDRISFLSTVNRFSSNYAPNFGKLLAPVVQGLRVKGPFSPAWPSEDQEIPRFVLIDGEGLGHTPASATSLPTAVTCRYETANVILLVDNATQPMQAAAQAVLRSVLSGGHDSKLAVAFTHFDQVIGDNLPNVQTRKNHVLASLENALGALEESLGSVSTGRVRRRLQDRVFFLSKIQEPLSPKNSLTAKSFKGLTEIFRNAIKPLEVTEAVPIYDLANLVLCLRLATEQFHEYWNAKLGLAYKPGLSKEHWTRVKALSRRFAYQWEDQYDNLRPVADLIALLSERLARFMDSPREWRPVNPPDDARDAAVELVAQEVYSRLHALIKDRLFHDQVHAWGTAYAYRGTGSTKLRARYVRDIYETAAPIPGETPSSDANQFLDVVRDLFRDAAKAAGAEVIG